MELIIISAIAAETGCEPVPEVSVWPLWLRNVVDEVANPVAPMMAEIMTSHPQIICHKELHLKEYDQPS
jgi:hypothetical protein